MSSVKKGELVIGFIDSIDFVTLSVILKYNMRKKDKEREREKRERNGHD